MTDRINRINLKRLNLKLLSLSLLVGVAGCASFYESRSRRRLRQARRVGVSARVHRGFLAGGTDDVDGNVETVRLLRSQLPDEIESPSSMPMCCR